MPATVTDQIVLALEANDTLMSFISEPDGSSRIYAAASLGQEEQEGGNPYLPPLPHIVWNELDSNPHREVDETSNAQDRIFTVWVYEEMGAISTLNTIMRLVRDSLKPIAPFETDDEGRVTEARWIGQSGLIHDKHLKSTARYGTLRVHASE